jgi:hypothetical protein
MTFLSRTIAIALHPHRLEVAELQQGLRGGKTLHLRSVNAPDCICESSGRVVNHSRLSQVIASEIERPSCVSRCRILLVVPSALCFLRSVEVPTDSGSFSNSWIGDRFREYLPSDPAELIVAAARCAPQRDKQERSLIAAIRHEHLAAYLALTAAISGEIALVMPACVARWNLIKAALPPDSRNVVVLGYGEGGCFEACIWDAETLIAMETGVSSGAEMWDELLTGDPQVWVARHLYPVSPNTVSTQHVDNMATPRVIIRTSELHSLSGRAPSLRLRALWSDRVMKVDDPSFEDSGVYDASLGAIITMEHTNSTRSEREKCSI